MIRTIFAVAVTVHASAAAAETDFGVRAVPSERGGAPAWITVERHTAALDRAVRPDGRIRNGSREALDLSAATRIGAQWGRVTSTRRSVARNARVGGVRNSYHLSGRAIDIARRAGVRHSDIAAALRRAGFHLIESLDEGDHSHFAFGSAPARRQAVSVEPQANQRWKLVYAPGR